MLLGMNEISFHCKTLQQLLDLKGRLLPFFFNVKHLQVKLFQQHQKSTVDTPYAACRWHHKPDGNASLSSAASQVSRYDVYKQHQTVSTSIGKYPARLVGCISCALLSSLSERR